VSPELGRVLGSLVMAIVLVGCGIVDLGEGDQVSAEQLGPVFARPGGDGPPIECRGLDQEQCLRPGTIDVTAPWVDVDLIDRVIVSCVGQCSPESGEFRIDLVQDGGTRNIGGGDYGVSRIGQ
jgi:hypothetical protein